MLILHNARIHTLNDRRPYVEAIAIEHNKIKFVGSNDQVLASSSINDQIINLSGKCILPGIIDSHIHLEDYALSLNRINCETKTIDECIKKVAEKACVTPKGEWIIGHGWNQNVWEGKFGSKIELDSVTPDNPVYLTAKSLHMGWANSTALKLAQIDKNHPDPKGGKLQRDEISDPTGILFESAMQLIENIIPPLSNDQHYQTILNAQSSLFEMGITGIQDFSNVSFYSILKTIKERGDLVLRIQKNLPFDYLNDAVTQGLYSDFGDDLLRIGSLKIFSDGALGPQTAAMLNAYENDASNYGILLLDCDQIIEMGIMAIRKGFSLAIHAIGDRANNEVIKAFSQIRRIENNEKIQTLRHRIEHVQIINPTDINLMVANSIIASIQPIHATSDKLIAEKFWGKRCKNAYAYNSLIKEGALLTMGSDAPVESPNPFLGIHAAVTRSRVNSSDSWYPDQCLILEEVLTGFTKNPAYVMGMKGVLGQIAPGFYADLIVLPNDPLSMPPSELWKLEPEATMINGIWVYQE